jgi:rRNA-processing protein FCF1
VSLVCFDTNFLIWGVKQQATPGQELNIVRVTHLLETLESQDKQILIPSIVLGEVLASLPFDQHALFVDQIQRSFILAPYDASAAAQYARMWQKRVKDSSFTRNETKADYMITAVAVANKCETIYSNDEGLRRFASEHIAVIGIDEITLPPEQGQLFS